MLILSDEHVPTSLLDYLRERGHDVIRARELFGSGTPDEILWQYGHEQKAVALTWDKDFRQIQRRTEGERDRFFNLSRLSLVKVDPVRAAQRIAQVIELLEFEYTHVQRLPDKRMIVTVTMNQVRIDR